jgi:replication factor A1
MSLSTDGVRKIISMTASSSDPGFNPVFQCISVKSVGSSGSGPTRYRAILSDGTFYVQGMLATQLNSMVESEELKTNAVISVQDFMKNSVQGRNVIILLKLTVLSNPGERIGAPENIENAGASAMRNNSSANGVKAAPMYNRTNTPENNAYNQGKPKPQSNANPKNPYSPATNRPNAPIVHQGNNGTPGGTPITPISQLNMYQNRWTIKARVVSKGDIRTWSNARGEGSLFSVELLDSSGMDIKATFFKDAVDKFFNQVDVGQVYHISGGRVKVANMQYNTCKSKYELNFDQNSEVRLVDDVGDIQAQSFELVKIADLERVDAGKNVDVIAVVQEIGEVQSLTSKKSGQELTKCDLTLIDDTGVQVRLTLWGKQAMGAKNDIALQQVVAFRKARVSDYGGVSLSGGSGVFVEPQIPETNSLKQWWETQGSKGGAVKSLSATYGGGGKMDSFSDRKTIADIKTEGLGYNSEKGDYLTFKAHFSFLKKDKEGGAWYTACPNKEDPCRNRVKVTQTTDGNWQCDRCQRTYQECSHKWIFSGTVADDTSSTWVSIFDDQAMVLFGGATADEAFAQFENQDFYDSHFAKAVHTEWILKCKVKSEMVNEEPRLKAQVVRMDPVDYAAECRDMLNEIQKFQ